MEYSVTSSGERCRALRTWRMKRGNAGLLLLIPEARQRRIECRAIPISLCYGKERVSDRPDTLAAGARSRAVRHFNSYPKLCRRP